MKRTVRIERTWIQITWSVMLTLLAAMLLCIHDAVPHTHHGRLFTAITDGLGTDMRNLFDHHAPVLFSDFKTLALQSLSPDVGKVKQTWTVSSGLPGCSVCLPMPVCSVSPILCHVIIGLSTMTERVPGLRAPPCVWCKSFNYNYLQS